MTSRSPQRAGNDPTTVVDCRIWTNTETCSPSLHLVTFDLKTFPSPAEGSCHGIAQRPDDDKNDVVAYGLPGIASNKDGDIAVVYGRSSPKMFMETRFSTWLHTELDVRPSRELHQGKAPLGAGCIVPCKPEHPDTAGVSVDPFDSRSIWIAHSFAPIRAGCEG
jgi:hypothetical protein